MSTTRFTLDFGAISLEDLPTVGGKNASLGEMYNRLRPLGVRAPDGFATTVAAWNRFMEEGELGARLEGIMEGVDISSVDDLSRGGSRARQTILETPIPDDIVREVREAYRRLSDRLGREPEVAVRSSATAEDLPGASFAGQQETYLNVRGVDNILEMVHRCFASLYTDRAISYRTGHEFRHGQAALSVGVQPMIRSDRGSAGVIFTLDPETGFRNVVSISGAWGLGESVVQGIVVPDEWLVFKGTLEGDARPIVGRRVGGKEVRLVYGQGGGTVREVVSDQERRRLCLDDEQVLELARWACLIEDHYSTLAGARQAMDIEWGLDGISGELFVLQARPETVHSTTKPTAVARRYRLTGPHGAPLITGQAVGERIAVGPVRVVRDAADLSTVQQGEVLVAELTDPDWEPIMRRVVAIVTDKGGRTAHAAIVSRELGLPCIVGAGSGTTTLQTGQIVTVSCAEGSEGHVYDGRIEYWIDTVDLSTLPRPRTKIMLITADPELAFQQEALPNDGVGLARMEFIVAKRIGVHPMALVRYPNLADHAAVQAIGERIGDQEPTEYFVRELSEGIGRIAAAFHPKPVILRTSDFKTNEYARLLGGAEFEPEEENPMLGFRGASRYYDPRYAEGFALECAAILRVRKAMGLTNLKVMIPFCRTPAEGARVVAEMEKNGLARGNDDLEIWAMCEIPSNAIDAEAFLRIFDGFSIGSNDLTQLVLGIDRDSGSIAHLFDERNAAVKGMISMAIATARRMGKPIGICGQAPSDYPDFAAWLVEQGISSISLNPDAVLKTTKFVAEMER